MSLRPPPPHLDEREEAEVRSIGLDAHRDFCEVALCEQGQVRSAGRVATRIEPLSEFAAGLRPDDQVAIEATQGATAIRRLLEPHVARVLVVDSRKAAALAQARAKTDRLDARALARLLAAGVLEEVWAPDEGHAALRRLLARRQALVRARTRAKNEVHAALARTLCPRPPVTDLFGRAGRRWLCERALPSEERLTVEGCLRQVDLFDEEISLLERALAEQAATAVEIRRLLTVPGVNMVTAATFVAWVGDVSRFPSPRKLVGYLGLDPRVRQSGAGLAHHGRISKEGARAVRHVLGESVWSVVMAPGPLRAFFQRLQSRKGPQLAATATARKLCVLFWHMLTRDEDYAFAQPALTRHKLRKLELAAGAPRHRGRPGPDGPWRVGPAQRAAERAIGEQAEHAYRQLVSDWQRQRPRGADATTGERRS
jgi:transposase